MGGYSSNQHIARSGKKAGQWVKCQAQDAHTCPLGGAHVLEGTLKDVQQWAGRRAWVDLTQKDYEDYLQSKIRGTLEQDRKPLETLEEKKARLGVAEEGRVTPAPKERKIQPGTRLRDIQALKDVYSEEEYYQKLFETYPEIDGLPLSDKKRIEKLLNELYPAPASVGANFTKKAAMLKLWAENGHVNNLTQLTASTKAERQRQAQLTPKAYVDKVLAQPLFQREQERSSSSAQTRSQTSSSKPKPALVVPPAVKKNDIPNFVPLNDDSVSTKAVLAQLQSYEVKGQGAFGAKTKEDKLVEYMVRNQLRFTGTAGNYGVEKISATRYASDLNAEVSHSYKVLPLVQKYHSLRQVKGNLEKTVDQHVTHEKMEKSIHDSFVSASKTELLTTLVQKGHEDSDFSFKVASATKASEIYDLRAAISQLSFQDEFSRAGL